MGSLETLLRRHGVPFVHHGEHSRATEGWVNVHCPHCGGNDFHLGLSEDGAAHCWKCGPHSTVDTLSKLMRMEPAEVRRLLEDAPRGPARVRMGAAKERALIPTAKERVPIPAFKYPEPSQDLQSRQHRTYLVKRGFDPDVLVAQWGIRETGPVSFLDGVQYSNRILIPIHWGGEVVSFQARDITGKAESKYMACPQHREVKHHKHILYGRQEVWGDTLIVTEGVVDVWRLGPQAVATFGIVFSTQQVLALSRAAERLRIVFDEGRQAQERARLLCARLRALGKDVKVVGITGDPGEMEQDKADQLVQRLIEGD